MSVVVEKLSMIDGLNEFVMYTEIPPLDLCGPLSCLKMTMCSDDFKNFRPISNFSFLSKVV